jgi:hypothetical protein
MATISIPASVTFSVQQNVGGAVQGQFNVDVHFIVPFTKTGTLNGLQISGGSFTATGTEILASATMSASSYLIGSVNGQVQADTDGDGLLDTWETNGIDVNNDGIIDFVLPQANPMHKNLYIETDYSGLMTGRTLNTLLRRG